MTDLLAGRVVIVTGAAHQGSIGEAIARRAAEEGARTILTSRAPEAAREAALRLKRAGRVEGRALDLSKDASVEPFVRATLHTYGHVDGLVHNAGFPVTKWDRSFPSIPPEDYAEVFDVDVVGAIRLTRLLLPSMAKRKTGSLVFTSSTAALAGYEHLHEFAPSKAGVLGIMRALAREFGPHGVRSNAVAYGNIKSPATYDALTPAQRKTLAHESPLRRWGEPVEAANASVFFLSDLSTFVNGQTLVIDGGTVSR